MVGLFCILWSCQPLNEPEKQAFKKQFPKLEPNRYNVGFLIMDGVYNTELTAPFDIFQHTIYRDSIKPMNVFTIANTDEPVRSFEGMRILPDFNYLTDSLPQIDICLLYTSPSPRDLSTSRMPSSA